MSSMKESLESMCWDHVGRASLEHRPRPQLSMGNSGAMAYNPFPIKINDAQ